MTYHSLSILALGTIRWLVHIHIILISVFVLLLGQPLLLLCLLPPSLHLTISLPLPGLCYLGLAGVYGGL